MSAQEQMFYTNNIIKMAEGSKYQNSGGLFLAPAEECTFWMHSNNFVTICPQSPSAVFRGKSEILNFKIFGQKRKTHSFFLQFFQQLPIVQQRPPLDNKKINFF